MEWLQKISAIHPVYYKVRRKKTLYDVEDSKDLDLKKAFVDDLCSSLPNTLD